MAATLGGLVRALCLAACTLVGVWLAPPPVRAQSSSDTEPASGTGDATTPRDPARAESRAVRGADWPWAVVGLGGAMVVAAVVTGVLTLVRQAELDAVCAVHSCPPAAERAQAEGRALAFSTDALGIAGLVVATAGVVLTLALPGEPIAPVTAAAACGPDGCTLTLGGAF